MGSMHDFWKAIHAGVRKAEAELDGVHVEWKAPLKENDREQQMNVMDNFINAGFDGIVLVPADNTALLKPVRDAVREGISVVIMDNQLDGVLCQDFASFIATNSYDGGTQAARRLAHILDGQGNVLVLRCAEGLVGSTQREQGFLDTIAREFPDIQVVSSDQYGGAEAETAFTKAENLLDKFPDLNGIFCPNESTTFGMLRALQESGKAGQVKFVGFDTSEKLIQAMKDDQLHGLVLQDPVHIGYTGVKTIVDYLRGHVVPAHIDTPCQVATPDNMNDPDIQRLLSPPIQE
jgi:ribose transport system substrate-binding protein